MTTTLAWAIPVATGLAGALGAGALTEGFSQLRDRRRAIRRALAELLELRYVILRSDRAALMPVWQHWMERHVGAPVAQALAGIPQIQSFMKDVMDDLERRYPAGSVSERFRRAVDELAPYDALLAYRLRDLDTLADLEAVFRDLLDKVGRLAGDDPNFTQQRGTAEAGLSREAREKSLTMLRANVLKLAGALGPISRLRAGAALSRQDEPPDNKELEAILDRALGPLFPPLQ